MSQPTASPGWRITGGDHQEPLGHVGQTLRFTMIAAANLAVASQTVRRDATAASATWRSGIWSSCSITRIPTGKRTLLKQPNIDTGMGLERLTMVLQGKNSVFETDLFRPIIDKFATLAQTTYGKNAEHDRSLRVIADHGRALVFLAGDGVLPSNTGRGYIFRRVLRRAVRHGKMLGLEGPFLAEAADTVIDLMKGHYAELAARRDRSSISSAPKSADSTRR